MFAGLTFTMPLGASSSVTASVEHGTSGGVMRTGVSGRVTEDGSIGYRGSLSHSRVLGDSTQQIDGSVDWKAPWLNMVVAADHGRDGSAGRLTASGAVVIAGGHALLGPPIRDAFAVVEVPGQADVPVFLENRPAGHTNGSGHALLTGLVANQRNHIRVAADNMPIDVGILDEEIILVPPRRGLVTARFDTSSRKSARGRAILEDGSSVPAGAQVERRSGRNSFIGLDGEFFLPDLDPEEAIMVRWLDQACRLRISDPVGPTSSCVPIR